MSRGISSVGAGLVIIALSMTTFLQNSLETPARAFDTPEGTAVASMARSHYFDERPDDPDAAIKRKF